MQVVQCGWQCSHDEQTRVQSTRVAGKTGVVLTQYRRLDRELTFKTRARDQDHARQMSRTCCGNSRVKAFPVHTPLATRAHAIAFFSPRLRICGHVTAITMDTFLCTQVCTSCEHARSSIDLTYSLRHSAPGTPNTNSIRQHWITSHCASQS